MGDSLRQKVAVNSIYNFASMFSGRFISIFFTMLLARLMNPEGFGTYFFALSIASIVMMFTDLGFGGALQRYVANSLAKGDEKLARSYARYLFKIKIGLLFIGSFLLFLTAPTLCIYVFNKPGTILIIQLASLYVFAESMNNFGLYGFIAVQDFKYKLVKEIVFQISRFIFIPVLLIFGFGPEGAMTGTVIAVSIPAILLWILFMKNYRYIYIGDTEKIPLNRLMKFVSYMTVYIVSANILFWIDSLMIGAMLPLESVGFYRAAGTIIFSLVSLVSIYQVVFPVFVSQTKEKAKHIFQEAYRLMATISFPLTIGAIILAEPIIALIYTPEYAPAGIIFAILSLLVLESATGSLIPSFFLAKEKPRIPALIFTFSLFVNVILNYTFIMTNGIIGAAVATILSRVSNSILLLYFLRREYSFLPNISSITKPLLGSLIMAATILILPPASQNILTLTYVAFGAVVYFIVMYVTGGITKSDINLVKSIFSKFRARH